MFGMTMNVEFDGFGITLRAFKKEEMADVANGFSSMKIHLYTGQSFAQTLENEIEWYDKMRVSKEDMVWAIAPDDSSKPVGVTGIHNINIGGSCNTGITIWDQKWWGKGVATRAHLGRMLFMADYLNRLTATSSVRVDNPASLKAVTKVGYFITGKYPRTAQRQGKFLDTYALCWLNPERISILFPEGLPEEYEEGVKKAKEALDLARLVISFH